MRGILKSRPVTHDPSSTVGEKSKEFADKALNLLNPGRYVAITFTSPPVTVPGNMNREEEIYSKHWPGGKMKTIILTGSS